MRASRTNQILVLSVLLLAQSALPAALSAAPPTAPASAPPAAAPAIRAPKPAATIYDESADATQQIAAALERAGRENRRVLIQWGGNWCPWCVRMHELFEANPEIARALSYEYDVVLVDTGRPAGKNVELAKRYGAAVDTQGFPFLTVLDASGKPVANQETASLEAKGAPGGAAGLAAGHDPQAVLAFLRKHQAPPVVAGEALAAALGDAKRSDRRVFLHFGAPWCPWCHRLDDWLRSPAIAPLIAKDYVDLKIDVDRMTGGKELLTRFRGEQEKGGIPWFAILDAEGQVVASSTMADGANSGFPAAPAELAHFEGMLRATAKAMSVQEHAELIDSLRVIERARQESAGARATPAPPAPALTEAEKIEKLIAQVEALQGATFIRNGSSHDAKDAAAHLRRKLGAQRSSIKTVDDFIRLCGTGSSISGDKYLIRFADGREVECAAFLREQAR